MMALYMPMQPSSNTPMMALLRRSSPASRAPSSSAFAGSLKPVERAHVADVVLPRLRPPATCASRCRKLVREILAPQRAVRDARLGQRGVQIQHADQARPLRRSSWRRSGSDPVRIQPVQNVVAVLPDGLHHHQRRSGGIPRNTSMPCFWLSMNPCPSPGRRRARARLRGLRGGWPCMTASSACACAGQHLWLADRRRSPFAIMITVSGMLSHSDMRRAASSASQLRIFSDKRSPRTHLRRGRQPLPPTRERRNQLRRHFRHRVRRHHALPPRIALQADLERHVEEHRLDLAAPRAARSRYRAAAPRASDSSHRYTSPAARSPGAAPADIARVWKTCVWIV